jgi:hypothetical protein
VYFDQPPIRASRPLTGLLVRSYPGTYAGRQTRFDARSWRRYGDWSVLGVPAVLLWLDNDPDQGSDDSCCDE